MSCRPYRCLINANVELPMAIKHSKCKNYDRLTERRKEKQLKTIKKPYLIWRPSFLLHGSHSSFVGSSPRLYQLTNATNCILLWSRTRLPLPSFFVLFELLLRLTPTPDDAHFAYALASRFNTEEYRRHPPSWLSSLWLRWKNAMSEVGFFETPFVWD